MKSYFYVIVRNNRVFGIDETCYPMFLLPELCFMEDMERYSSKEEAESALKRYIEDWNFHILDDAKVMKMVAYVNLEEI